MERARWVSDPKSGGALLEALNSGIQFCQIECLEKSNRLAQVNDYGLAMRGLVPFPGAKIPGT